ncbi:MAG: methyltransferase domain-containing protein [Alphaproteobacteria bacterium]
MVTDVIDLRDFYETSLGQVACRLIRRRVREFWPDVRGLRVLGLGYATPYLRPFRGEAERVLAVMPASQGVLHWPPDGPGLVALADEAELPFADNAIDRMLLVHTLESTEQVRAMLREVWRVLAGNGRLLVVAPNRRGLWARLDRSPFGHGHPFTPSQLSRLLRDNMFTPVGFAAALYMPPTSSRVMLTAAAAWERIGDRMFQTFAGVVLVEAAKQVYAATPAKEVRRRPLFVPITQTPARARAADRGRTFSVS